MLTSERVGTEQGTVHGTVVRSTGSWYDVQSGDRLIPSRVRGRFRLTRGKETSPVVVGDSVEVRLGDDDTGLIVGIGERSRCLLRRAAGKQIGRSHVIAANVDFAWVVQAADQPKFNPGFVDRFLVMAASNQLPVGIIVNKRDILLDRAARSALGEWRTLYEDLGYEVIYVSAHTGRGLRKLKKRLRGKISVMAGPSGVGKSSLMNEVCPDLDLRTGEVSEATGKGVHTTTVASLHRLKKDGFVVDTPGLREFGLIGLDPPHLSHYFPEMAPLLPQCRFQNCTHDHEPNCAIKKGVEKGDLNLGRYESYIGMLNSLHLGDADVGR